MLWYGLVEHFYTKKSNELRSGDHGGQFICVILSAKLLTTENFRKVTKFKGCGNMRKK